MELFLQTNNNKTSLESRKPSNEENDTEFIYAKVKPEGANGRCGNKDVVKSTNKPEDDK